MAEQVAALQGGGDGFHLDLAGPFESALLNDSPEFVLEEEIAPADRVGGVFGGVCLGLDIFVGAVLTELHCSLLLPIVNIDCD